MNKYKVTLIIIVIGLFLLFIIAGYTLISKNQQKELSPIIQAVPLNASIIIETSDLSQLLNQLENKNNIWKELKPINLFKKFNSQVLYIYSLINTNNNIFAFKNVLISAHLQGKDKINFLYLISLPKTANQKRIKKLISDLLLNKAKITERKYNNETIYDVKIDQDSVPELSSFSFCITEGIFIFSFSSLLLENSIRQVKSNNPISIDYGFKKVSKTAGKNVILNIYTNYEKLYSSLIPIISDDFKQAKEISNFANWSALDLQLEQSSISLSGYTFATKNSDKFLNIFRRQNPQKNSIPEILPDKTAQFISFSFDDVNNFKQDYHSYLKALDLEFQYKKTNIEFEKEYKINPEKILFEIISKQITIAKVNYQLSGGSYTNYIIFNINNKKNAMVALNSITEAYCDTNKLNIEDYSTIYQINENSSIEVCKLPFENILNYAFGELYDLPMHKYYVFLDDYLVFSDSFDNLKKIINSHHLNLNLKNDEKFKELDKQIALKSNILFYLDFNRADNNILFSLNKDLSTAYKKNIKRFNKFQTLCLQINTDSELFYTNLFIDFNINAKTNDYSIWQTQLKSKIVNKPFFFTNHYSFEKEIFVQDASNIIYLIDKKGKILWQKQLPDRIISEVYQVDLYNNTKYQILFNTTNNIYIIDRNGDFVENYPVKLPATATNGISVFDYNNNNDYRFFIACSDRRVYLFQKDGQINEDWQATQTDDYVKNQIQYFNYKDKDYIIFADKLKIYILNRKGEARIKPNERYPLAMHTKFFFQESTNESNAKFICTTPAGKIINIYLDGKTTLNSVKDVSHSHYFEYKDVNNDGSNDFIFLDKNSLSAYTQSNKKIFSHYFTVDITERPIVFKFSAEDTKFGVVAEKENKIYLINNDGTIHSDFPKRGSTPFTIGILNSDNKFNIIVGFEDKFLYNYLLN